MKLLIMGWIVFRHRGRRHLVFLMPPQVMVLWVEGRYPDCLFAN